MGLVTQISPVARYYFSSNGKVQIQHLVVPRSRLSCTSCGIRGTFVAGWLWSQHPAWFCAIVPALAVQGYHRLQLILVSHRNAPWMGNFWEALQSGWQRQKLLFARGILKSWQEIGLSTYTIFTAWILSLSFFSHLTPCTIRVFFTGVIWLSRPATWKGLPDSCSLVKDRFGSLCTEMLYKPKAFVPLEAFLVCDIPACWSSYLEEQMLKIKIFLSEASSLAVCLARLYLIIFCWCVVVKRKPRRKIGN